MRGRIPLEKPNGIRPNHGRHELTVWFLRRFFGWLSRKDDADADRWAHRLGSLYLRFSGRARNCTSKNIAAVYPELTDSQREALARESAAQTMWGLVETARIWNWERERLDACIVGSKGHGHAHDLLAREKGLLVIAPHFGAWELMSIWLAGDYDVSILYKPPANAGLDREIKRHRERVGSRLVPANRAGIRDLHNTIDSGGVAAVLPDQRPKAGQGRLVPFFGFPAWTGVLAPRLVRRHQCPAVFAVLQRVAPGQYFQHFVPVEDEFYAEDLDTALAAMNRGIEQCIAIDPAQYLWSYKRFKTEAGRHSAFYDD